MIPSPEQTGKWLGTLMPLLERGSAVVSLVLLLLGGVTLYGMGQEVKRVQGLNKELVHLLLAEKDARVALALRLAHCPPAP